MKIVCTVDETFCRVSVDFVISKLMVFRNVIVDITISSRLFVFSQSRVELSTSLSNVGGLAVGAFDLINCSLSVVRFVSVFNVGQLML